MSIKKGFYLPEIFFFRSNVSHFKQLGKAPIGDVMASHTFESNNGVPEVEF